MPTPELGPHYPVDSEVTTSGEVAIGGVPVSEIVAEYGTPVYIVAEDDLRLRSREYLTAFGQRHADFEVAQAIKAFPSTAVGEVFQEEGLSCLVATGGELHVALKAGFVPERIYFHGNAKSEAELRYALDS